MNDYLKPIEKGEAKTCPFCGHSSVRLNDYIYTGLHKEDEGSPCERVSRVVYYVECQYCGARGPIEHNAPDALTSWNGNFERKEII